MRSVTSRHALFTLLLGLGAWSAAHAGDISVNTLADDNAANSTCSLREAMQAQFNGAAYQGCTGATAAGPNRILLTKDGTYTVPVTLAKVIANRPLEVTGAGHTATIKCTTSKLFITDPNSSLNLNNLKLQGCTTSGSGLAVTSAGDLTMTLVTVDGFVNTTGADGAAITHTGGNLYMTTVTMSNNKADDGNVNSHAGNGGALAITNVELPKKVLITGSMFDSNTADRNGGAVYINNNPSLGHSIAFTGVTFQNNQALGNQTQDGGGAVWIQSGQDVTDVILMTQNYFLNNKATNGAGGAVLLAFGSQLAYVNANAPSLGGIFASAFYGNVAGGPAGNDGSGGAIFSRGNLTVVQASFQANKSTNGSGGAIAFGNSGSSSVIANATFNGNSAAQNGGAIARLGNSDAIALVNATIAGNAAGGAGGNAGGGGIWNTSSVSGITVRNSLVVSAANANGVTNVGGNCKGGVVNMGNNLQFAPNNGCGTDVAFDIGDPLLGAMTISPGPNALVFTMPISANFSPALNAGDEAACEAGPMLAFDATGRIEIRPSNGSSCDIGAYESSNKPDIIFQDGLE